MANHQGTTHLGSYFHHPPSFSVHSPLPLPFYALPFLCTTSRSLCRLSSLAPDMVLSSTGPPGPNRPKSSSSPSPSCSIPSQHGHIFSPTPSRPSPSNQIQALFSLGVPQAPLTALPPAVSAHLPYVQPHGDLASDSCCLLSLPLPSEDNTKIINLATTAFTAPSNSDPWTRAHLRVCAHAAEECAACSIALICCSCRALRFTPGPPPISPTVITQRSRSASPALFRNLATTPPPDNHDWNDAYDDDAYSRALAECDTCDNINCPRGADEPASWTITVEHFDEDGEEFYDRTFRACAACNRSCKKTFMTHRIKARQFDNSSKALPIPKAPAQSRKLSGSIPINDNAKVPSTLAALAPVPLSESKPNPPLEELVTLPKAMAPLARVPSPAESRPLTPLETFSAVACAHRKTCGHLFTTCPTCSRGITCCQCNSLHTAPARLKLRCVTCLHYACATCTTPFCCSCRKPWFPGDSPTLVLANRFRGGARSTKSSKKGSSSSSQSSGPGSLATAHSARNSPDPFTQAPVIALPTQSSADEIDAFGDATVRVSEAVATRDEGARERSAHAPSPSSNLPQASVQVFSRPPLPVITGATEDVPTAVPSRAPSRAASIVSTSSIGDAGIAIEPTRSPFPAPVDPPAFNDIIGRIHRRFPLASLKVDDEDSRHFLARDNTRVDDIANETDYLLSSHTSWPSILYFIRDTMNFESIQGPSTDFQVVLSGLAEIWSDAASFDARELLRDMLESSRLFPKAEKEIDRLEAVSARYRSERQAARTQLKTTEAELSRLRQAANDTLDSNARLLSEIDQLRATDAVTIARERDEAQAALKDAIAHSKAAMAKQVSMYQHLANISDKRGSRIQELEKEALDKDAYILKTEQEHAEIYREREAAERSVTSLKQDLQNATSLFEATREARRHDQEDFDERTTSFKKHIAELNSKLNLLPAGESELRSLVADANERAGIAEEEYRKKSAELKLANKEISALKAKQVKSAMSAEPGTAPTLGDKRAKAGSSGTAQGPKKDQAQAKVNKSVRWGFEPSDDAPASQPFWDHTNEYSKYIASMIAATVTAIPSIPMQMAISTAIETVKAAGLSILSHSPKPADIPKAPSFKSTPASASNSTKTFAPPAPQPRPVSPAAGGPSKGSKAAPIPVSSTSPATVTFAQMAASVLGSPAAAPVHSAKARPTWRAIETNKSLVLRPGTKGTRVSELHIRVPKVPSTAQMSSLSGTKLINEVLRLVNESHNKEGIKAIKDNHIVLAKWSMRGNLIIKCSKPMDDSIKDCLHDAIKSAVPPSSADSIAILNKPPTTALKFMTVPKHNEDGTETDLFDLFNDLMAHELWRDVELFSQPRFLPTKHDTAGGTVIVSVVDDNQGTVGRKLMNTVVSFSGASRRCLRWVEKEAQLLCTQCQCWGHLNYNCLSNVMRCSKCAGPHDYRQHDRFCEICKSGKGKLCLPKCHNCHGPHFSNSKDCVFYINRSSKERQVQLRDEFSQKWKEEAAALKAAANTDSGRAARTAVAIKAAADNAKASTKNKAKSAAKHRIDDDDDFIPVGKGGKSKYTFGGMADRLAETTRIEVVTNNEDEDKDSDTSSDLRLSYLDDVPLKTRFPNLRSSAPASKSDNQTLLKTADSNKPLTITLPAPSTHKPLRSVTDILRELKNPERPISNALAAPSARFAGGEVAYTPSAIQAEADAFASALLTSNLPSQPSPTPKPAPELPSDAPATVLDAGPTASSLQSPTNPNV